MKGAVIQAGQEGRCRRPGKGQEGVKQPPEGGYLATWMKRLWLHLTHFGLRAGAKSRSPSWLPFELTFRLRQLRAPSVFHTSGSRGLTGGGAVSVVQKGPGAQGELRGWLRHRRPYLPGLGALQGWEGS